MSSSTIDCIKAVLKAPWEDPFLILRIAACSSTSTLIRDIVKAANPVLAPAREGNHALIPLSITISVPYVPVVENKTDELANQTDLMVLASVRAAVGRVIDILGGPVGVIVVEVLVGIAAGLLKEFAYANFKEWLLTEGEDGVKPIDRIAETLRSQLISLGFRL